MIYLNYNGHITAIEMDHISFNGNHVVMDGVCVPERCEKNKPHKSIAERISSIIAKHCIDVVIGKL